VITARIDLRTPAARAASACASALFCSSASSLLLSVNSSVIRPRIPVGSALAIKPASAGSATVFLLLSAIECSSSSIWAASPLF
jgi:hypothetical protein